MDSIVTKKLYELKPHPKNSSIFGDPQAVPEYDEIKRSIRENGIQEPLVVLEDGTILSGHLRFCALKDISAERGQYIHEVDVPVRVHPAFGSENQELEYLFAANIQRRQLSPRQIALAYKALVEAAKPTKPAVRRKRGEINRGQRRPPLKEKIARLFNTSVRNAENLAVIYQTAGVPSDVLDLVDAKAIPVRTAYEAVKFATDEARRRSPGESVVVDPIDVRAYLSYPRGKTGTRFTDLLRGARPRGEEVLIDGEPVREYFGHVETAKIPPPFMPRQTVQDMLRRGVEYSDQDFSDPGLPLHESVNRLRSRLTEAFSSAHTVNEARVVEALAPMLESVAHYLRVMGQDVTVSLGVKAEKVLPETLYEKLVLFRTVLEEDVGTVDPAILRTILLDISKAAQERAGTLRKKDPPKAVAPIPRKESPVFATDLEFIAHVIGQPVIDFLGSDP